MDHQSERKETERPYPNGLVRGVINNFEYLMCAAALLTLVALLTISIAGRYVGGLSLPWSEELARYMFIGVIFASISYAARQHRHIRVTMLIEKMFSRKAQVVVLTIGDLVWLGYNAVVLYAAYVVIAEMFEFPYNSAVLNLPMYFVYAIIPIFFLTLSIRIIQGIFARLGGQNIDGCKDELS